MQHKQRAAFFDVDNTLLNLKSMFSFQEYFYVNAPAMWRGQGSSYAEFVELLNNYPARHDRLALNRFFYESFKGRRHTDVLTLAQQWFSSVLLTYGDKLWVRSAIDLAGQLRDEGYLLVAVSGSSHEILAPVIEYLGFDQCLATRLELDGDLYTGKIVPPQVIGSGKAKAIMLCAAQMSFDLNQCVACGDHITDLPMLEAVGKQYIVSGDPALEQIAATRKWPVLQVADDIQEPALAHV